MEVTYPADTALSAHPPRFLQKFSGPSPLLGPFCFLPASGYRHSHRTTPSTTSPADSGVSIATIHVAAATAASASGSDGSIRFCAGFWSL